METAENVKEKVKRTMPHSAEELKEKVINLFTITFEPIFFPSLFQEKKFLLIFELVLLNSVFLFWYSCLF